ncbi:hypothetical protein NP233_g9046 [Leucocoprinus birnbaumii]|uniref:Nephrocystin 3-like N-terminal domain-containing protein n=1 Tax=Leucocoprinus birnbaumii TaxID=56174 RepID=A0AAD5VLB3_9AGAR|nr:hypothetical protein NP233_g9046 [Leucocoprinus birnbaumii]
MSYLSNSRDFKIDNSSFTNIDQSSQTSQNFTHVDRIENVNIVTHKLDPGLGNRAGKDISTHPGARALTDSSSKGLQILLDHSMPSAFHDSSERYPPPLCHPGTRQSFIEELTNWALGNAPDHPQRLAWMRGPAGVGKSAIAQSLAQLLGATLGASFFFSRPNHRDDPNRVFTSIAYQLAVKIQVYGDLLNRIIQGDPTIAKKSLPTQFHELIVAPIRVLKQQGRTIPETVIIIDGLDECDGEGAQGDIIRLIAESIRDEDMPFRWVFFTRVEPHITSTFSQSEIAPFTARFELTVTRDIDPEIHLFLASRLKEVREKHNLPDSWPSGENLRDLVDISAGLFACAHAIARYIEDSKGASTPQKQLDAVLGLASRIELQKRSEHPLSSLDLLYTLMLERLHPEKLAGVQMILLSNYLPFYMFFGDIHREHGHISSLGLTTIANILGHTREDLFIICRSLHAVMEVDDNGIRFYHASFMDFAADQTRSRGYCIWSSISIIMHHLVRTLDNVRLDRDLELKLDLTWPTVPEDRKLSISIYYTNLYLAFFIAYKYFLSMHEGQPGNETFESVKHFDFRKFFFGLDGHAVDCFRELDFDNAQFSVHFLASCLEHVCRPLGVFKDAFSNPWHVFHQKIGSTAAYQSIRGLYTKYYVIGENDKRIIFKIVRRSYDGQGQVTRISAKAYSSRAMRKLIRQLVED